MALVLQSPGTPERSPIEYFAGLAQSHGFWIGFPLVGVLGIAGLTLLGKNWRTWLLPLLFLPSYAAGIVLFFCPARFRLPVIPVLILLAAVGLVRGVQLLAARRFKPLAVYAGLGALAAGFIGTNPPNRSTFEHEEESAAHLQLGQFYAKTAKEDAALREQASGICNGRPSFNRTTGARGLAGSVFHRIRPDRGGLRTTFAGGAAIRKRPGQFLLPGYVPRERGAP